MGPSLDPDQAAVDRRRALLDRARAARDRAAEALADSAALAERHAQRAEEAGDVERADYERRMARRTRAAVQRIRDRSRPS